MTLIARPNLIAIDNSIIGKITEDYFSKDIIKQQKAADFIEKTKIHGYVPLFCFHHIAEILQHENDRVIQNRLSLISKFSQIAWIKPKSKNISIGSIIDIQGLEIQKILESPNISLNELSNAVRKEIICYSSGYDFTAMIEPECLMIKELNLLDIQKGKAIDSISHVRDPDIDNIKLSVLKRSRLKTYEEVNASFNKLNNHYLSNLHERGDKKLENHENVVSEFLLSVSKLGEELYNHEEDSLYLKFIRASGIEEKYISPDWTIGEFGYFSIFVKKLEVISRSFSLNKDSVLQHPLSKFPSWHIWVELDKCIRKEKYASGSNIIDKYLGSFSIYADLLIVDKRIKEYFKQIIRKDNRFSLLRGKIIKCSDYTSLLIT